ncbi:transcriptional coactivator p15/PC4 family protein [Bradyrhizobium sp. RT10b]|uniref:transcriptional coactivator p15/PC4 family protein n=1 Tax=Bradyrhizobium sp. RT10b TaxID=3156331 RepID=UPI0033986330
MSGYRKTSRKMPARPCPIAENEPIEIHKMWRDRRGNALVFALKSYQGRAFFDLRTFYTDQDGILKPTSKGVTASPSKLPEIARALVKALERARELGLLMDEAAE